MINLLQRIHPSFVSCISRNKAEPSVFAHCQRSLRVSAKIEPGVFAAIYSDTKLRIFEDGEVNEHQSHPCVLYFVNLFFISFCQWLKHSFEGKGAFVVLHTDYFFFVGKESLND